jgi:hypothetical protein
LLEAGGSQVGVALLGREKDQLTVRSRPTQLEARGEARIQESSQSCQSEEEEGRGGGEMVHQEVERSEKKEERRQSHLAHPKGVAIAKESP